ncbi:MAG: FAD-binding protein [Gammaproteobacteria bacterium]
MFAINSPFRLIQVVGYLAAIALFLTEVAFANSFLEINDIHSRLNPTHLHEYHEPSTTAEIVALLKRAAKENRAISISGGRHAMGGQQFGSDTIHISTKKYNRVLALDASKGLVRVESGIQWPELIAWLLDNQKSSAKAWGIRQKQTGADQLSIGGALSANVHGRGLTMQPFVSDVESVELVDAQGKLIRASREQNPELFSLVAGGYGLFGVITEVTLRLSPRTRLVRKVEIVPSASLDSLVKKRIDAGFMYGDFQFKTDETSEDFLKTGVFSFYRPIASPYPEAEPPKELTEDRWNELYKLAHLDKAKAFQAYTDYYLTTDGQFYWSDTHQLSYYSTGLDQFIDQAEGSQAEGSLMITELYVPRAELDTFLGKAATALRKENANLVYGTVRFIEKDTDSFLAWASQPYASIVMNLRVIHDDEGIDVAKRQFQTLIDVALELDGSYFLTYHRWARKDQVLAAYPQFPDFLLLKKKYDPDERFQSDWYRYYRKLLSPESKVD